MYGRLSLIPAGAGERTKMEDAADRLAPLYREQRGFKDMTFFHDEQGGLYGSLTLWASREDAEAAAGAMNAARQEALATVALGGQPQVRMVEIYEPNG